MSKRIAVTFPGQGSQIRRHASELATAFPVVRQTSKRVTGLGVDLWALSQHGPKNLDETQNTQPAMLCAGMSVMRVMEPADGASRRWVLAGHSLGEYGARGAGVIELADAVRLVSMRGRFMVRPCRRAPARWRRSLGTDDDQVRGGLCCGRAGQVAEAVNFIPRDRWFVAGDAEAIKRVAELVGGRCQTCVAAGRVSVPFHCALMGPAAERLAEAMHAIAFRSLDCRCCTTSA